MARMSEYMRGYYKGRSEANEIVSQDLIGVYGAMALVLAEKGYDEDSVIKLQIDIHDKWVEVCESGGNMIELVAEKCGFDIEQLVKGGK